MPNTNDKSVKHKVGWMMGVSRDTFYRYKEVFDDSGVKPLLDQNRRVPNVKNRVDPVVEYTIDKLADGQVRVSNELRKQGVFVPPDGVGSVWLRHDLAHFTQCLKALEAKLAEDGLILTGYHKHWNVRNTMTRAAVKSIRPPSGLTRHVLCQYIQSCCVGLSTNRRGHLYTNFTQRSRRLPQQICSMIVYWGSMLERRFLYFVS